jgi:hypothetical protein
MHNNQGNKCLTKKLSALRKNSRIFKDLIGLRLPALRSENMMIFALVPHFENIIKFRLIHHSNTLVIFS